MWNGCFEIHSSIATEKYFDSQLVYSPIAYNWSQEIKALGYVLINFQIDCFENF